MIVKKTEEEKENCKCIFHPGKKFQSAKNQFSDYCADLTVALAYHKILDDVKDDGTLKAKIGEKALREQYEKVRAKLPETVASIEKFMNKISEMENDPTGPESGDEIAKNFGMLLGSIFAPKDDNWKETLVKFSANLGRFVYFMDAAVDYEDDIKENKFNPYKAILKTDSVSKDAANEMKMNLSVLAGQALQYFENLPLEQDLNLLQNILYEGMWIQFNHKYFKKGENIAGQ